MANSPLGMLFVIQPYPAKKTYTIRYIILEKELLFLKISSTYLSTIFGGDFYR